MTDVTITSDRMQEFYIDADSIPVHAKLEFPENFSGKCPLVIVQHGLTGHMEEDHIIGVSRSFNKCGYATLRTELYGHGMSGGEFSEHTLFKWLSQMITVIDYARGLGFVTDLFLCGHSQGGLLVVLAGAMKRDVIRAILPLAPAVMIPEDARNGSLLGVPFDPDHVPDTVRLNDTHVLSGNYLRAAQLIYAEPAIDAYDGEVLIIHGDSDGTVPVRAGIEAARRYKHAKLVIIPGADHCYEGHLDEVTKAIEEYMTRF